jgi:hypothetical protein
VEVVEHEYDRRVGPGVRKEPRGRLEQPEPGGVRVRGRRLPNLGEQVAHVGQHLCEVGGTGADVVPNDARVLRAQVRSKRLDPGPVRRRAAGLPAPSPEHAEAARRGAAGQLVGQAALADAGFAGEEDEPPAAAERLVERGDQLGELALAADEYPLRTRPDPPAAAASPTASA